MNSCQKNNQDSLGQLIKYEHGELEPDEIIELFQTLINNGLAWQLQGHYGRTAKSLIELGYCKLGGK